MLIQESLILLGMFLPLAIIDIPITIVMISIVNFFLKKIKNNFIYKSSSIIFLSALFASLFELIVMSSDGWGYLNYFKFRDWFSSFVFPLVWSTIIYKLFFEKKIKI